MPAKPLKPCNKPGCINLTNNAYCSEHTQVKRSYDMNRESSSKRGYNHRWRVARKHYLMRNHTCVSCGQLATVIDHIIPHRGNQSLFWDMNNWQPLCKSCHDRKTATEDGGF